MNTDEKIHLRDTAIYINSSTDGQLDLVADTEIQIAATTIDINGAVAFDGVLTGGTWQGTAIASGYIANDAITGAKIADDAIDSEHYTDGSIDTAHLASDVITGAKIADDAIDSEHYTDGSVDTAHLAADVVTGAKIADDAIGSEHIADDAITSALIADDAITTALIADDAITSALIADDAVVTAAIADNAITNALMADDAIDSAEIADGAIDLVHMSTESVDEDNLHISNSGSNGQFLSRQSGNSGGLTWATPSSSATALDDIAAGDAAANLYTTVGNITIDAQANDADVIIKVDDNGSAVTAVTFDGSDEGNAIFVNDVQLKSDSAVLEFGADLDTTLTHTDGTGLTLNSTNKLTFGDTGTFIHQSSDGVLTIESDTTVDINGAVVFNGAITGPTAVTVDDIAIDGKVITMTGDTSDTVVFTAGAAGTLSIVTTDAAGTAGDVTIDADGEIVIDPADAAGTLFKIAGTTQLSIIDGAILPTTNNDIDLGSDAKEFKNVWIDGTLETDNITIGGAQGSDGQVLTSTGSAVAWEDAGGGGGTFTAIAIEDLAAGDPVALVSDSADSDIVKVEKIRGMTEFSNDPQNSYDALASKAYRKTIFHCSDIDKWARVFTDPSNYYVWVQVGDYSTTTKQITWGEAVAVTDFSAYPSSGCWVGGSFDRIFIAAGRGSEDVKGYLYEVNTSTNKVVTADGGGLYAPGTAYTITDGAYDRIVCHFATTGEAANKIIVAGSRDDSGNERKFEIHALTPTGGSTNTVTDFIAGAYLVSVQNAGTFPSFSWNDHGTGKGLLTFIDGADSNYFKAVSVIANDTPGFTASSYTEILGADNTDQNASCDVQMRSITADTSNGNFVIWLRGATDGAAKAAVVTVANDGTITSGSSSGATTVFANMSAHTGIAADFSNLGGITGYTVEKTSTTSNQGIVNRRGVGVYDPDADCHVFLYWLESEKLGGWTEYSLYNPSGHSIRAICTVTLAGTGDRTITAATPDWIKPVIRGVSIQPNGFAEANYGCDIAYDTTHDQTLFEEHCHEFYMNHQYTPMYDGNYLFQGTTTANKYRRSNMDKFIGFNTAAVTISSSTTATITVAGGLNENISTTLTKGQKYYIADSGQLRTTIPPSAFYLYKAGIATDTDKLLVQATYMNPNGQ